MTISDLLTLVGILLAIIANISERSREYIILKFSKIELWIFAVLFLYINFLLSYQWWQEKSNFLKKFEFNGFPSTKAWAYIFSIGILFYFIWKIFWGNFPRSRNEELLSYYKKLLLRTRNGIPFLAELVEKYHLKDIIDFLNKTKTINIKNKQRFGNLKTENFPMERQFTALLRIIFLLIM